MAMDRFKIKTIRLLEPTVRRGDAGRSLLYGGTMSSLLSTIETKLTLAFAPSELVVEDESHHHAGHGGAAEHAAEFGASEPSHIHIRIKAEALSELSRLARHRAVMDAISDEVKRLHAIRLTAG